MPAVAPPHAPNSPPPQGAAAAAPSGGATGTAPLPPRPQRDPQRGDLILHLPGGASGGGHVRHTPACVLCGYL